MSNKPFCSPQQQTEAKRISELEVSRWVSVLSKAENSSKDSSSLFEEQLPLTTLRSELLDQFQEKLNLPTLLHPVPPGLKTYREIRQLQNKMFIEEKRTTGLNEARLGYYKDACKSYSHALEIDPEDIDTLLFRGALYANQENYKAAIKDFRKILRLDPSHSQASTYLSICLMGDHNSEFMVLDSRKNTGTIPLDPRNDSSSQLNRFEFDDRIEASKFRSKKRRH